MSEAEELAALEEEERQLLAEKVWEIMGNPPMLNAHRRDAYDVETLRNFLAQELEWQSCQRVAERIAGRS